MVDLGRSHTAYGLGGKNHGKAMLERDVHDTGDEIKRGVLVSLENERRRNAAGRQLIEALAKTVERDDLVVEIKNCRALERRALVVKLLGRQRDRHDETARGSSHPENTVGRIDLDARLKHKGGAKQEKAEQQQNDVDDWREVNSAAQRLQSARKDEGHGKMIKEEAGRKKSILHLLALYFWSMRGKWLLWVRRAHLYLSVFFAPLLLLFVITGWAQTVGFARHDDGSLSLMEKLSDVHKNQFFPTDNSSTTNGKAMWSFAGQTGTENSRITWPTKWLVVAMCIALIISISLGLILAFTMVRNRIFVWIALILGVATPVLLLAVAHVK
jgi:preprotein translocase subunit SecE